MKKFQPNKAVTLKNFSPEMELLCTSCRVQPRPVDLSRQAALASQIDEERLLALSKRHRIEPLLYHNLSLHSQGVFSNELLSKLAARARRLAFKSLQALHINHQLSGLLQQKGISYVPLKGVAIAQQHYGEISLRHTNDIDFWVPEASLAEARSILLELGCEVDMDHDFQDVEGRGARHFAFIRRFFHHETWIHPSGLVLELHWRLTVNAHGLHLDPETLCVNSMPTGYSLPQMESFHSYFICVSMAQGTVGIV
jgi:hypothetical protein